MTDSTNPYETPQASRKSDIFERATCPSCQTTIPRSFVFSGITRTCRQCGVRFKPALPQSVVAPILAYLVILPTCIGAFGGILSWGRAGGVCALVLVAGWFLFPYLTPFRLVPEK